MNKFESELAQNLMQINAIKISLQNPFKWASGIVSPIYCDNRLTLSYPAIRDQICRGLTQLTKAFPKVTMVTAVATAGIPHGVLVANALNLPFSYVRATAKSHGRQNIIEGDIKAGSKIVVIEDLISTGNSSLDVVQILRDAGHEVLTVVSIFDYGFSIARENFKKYDCTYQSLLTYKSLLKHAVSSQYISQEEEQILSKWSSDPENWYQNHFITT